MSKTVREIIVEYLKQNGYDGLYNDFDGYGCGCSIDVIFACGEIYEQCRAGHKIPCNPLTCPVNGKCEDHIGVKDGGK